MIFTTALVSAVLAALIVWLFARQRQAALSERLTQRETEIARFTESNRILEASRTDLSTKLSALTAELAAERAASAERLQAAESRLAEREALAKQYLADLEKLRATMQTEFQSVAAKLLANKCGVEAFT